MAGYNPYEPMQPTPQDLAWEARYKKWEEEENARNALEDAARLRAGQKLPGTGEAAQYYDTNSPESGYYDRAKALIDQQNRNRGIPSTAQGPATPVPFDLNESTWQPTPTQANALAMVDMMPAHSSVPVGPEMASAHTPGSSYRETSLRTPTPEESGVPSLRNYTQADYNVGHGVGADKRGAYAPYRAKTDLLGYIRDKISGETPNMPGVFSQPQGGGVVGKSDLPLEQRLGDDMMLAATIMSAGAAPAVVRGAVGLGGIPKQAVMEALAPAGITEANIAKQIPGLAKKIEGGWLQSVLGGSEVYPKNLSAYAGGLTRKANIASLTPEIQAALKKMASNFTPNPIDALKMLAGQKTTKSFLPYEINQAGRERTQSVTPSFWQHLNELVPLYNDTPFGQVGP